jgi:hypothetical protein
MSCVNAKGESLYQEFVEACSQAVRQDLAQAKRDHFDKEGDAEGKVKCDITGERVSFKEAQLDHKKPMTFQVIVMTLIAAYGIEIKAEMLSAPADNQYVTTFVDQNLEQRFREYRVPPQGSGSPHCQDPSQSESWRKRTADQTEAPGPIEGVIPLMRRTCPYFHRHLRDPRRVLCNISQLEREP